MQANDFTLLKPSNIFSICMHLFRWTCKNDSLFFSTMLEKARRQVFSWREDEGTVWPAMRCIKHARHATVGSFLHISTLRFWWTTKPPQSPCSLTMAGYYQTRRRWNRARVPFAEEPYQGLRYILLIQACKHVHNGGKGLKEARITAIRKRPLCVSSNEAEVLLLRETRWWWLSGGGRGHRATPPIKKKPSLLLTKSVIIIYHSCIFTCVRVCM